MKAGTGPVPCDDAWVAQETGSAPKALPREREERADKVGDHETGPGCGPGAVVIVGAGPAGLTAAYELSKRGVSCTVFEMDEVVGGLSRTVEREGWRFDIGGHRFFTKVPEVKEMWQELLKPEDFIRRHRLSRIYYEGTYYDYPIRLGNALRGLGLAESVLCGLSFFWVRLRPPKDLDTFEGWTARAFGWRLYRTFFKTYTEKIWGMPATQIRADWAAQRIKSLTLGKALGNALSPRRSRTKVTSLIEEFSYPRLGPGMMWERASELVQAQGSKVLLSTRLETIRREPGRAIEAVTRPLSDPGNPVDEAGDAALTTWSFDHLISSMPLSGLVEAMDPPAPREVLEAARALRYRDFLTVALVLPAELGFPDNWIYVHSDKVRVGRVQNFGSWSPDLVKGGRTCLGLEYFVFEGDDMWSMDDEDLVELGTKELITLGLVRPGDVERGYVVRVYKAYPVYDEGYGARLQMIRDWLEAEVPNVHPVGRNGMHRYNNQDHSMLTAMLTVETLYGEAFNTWDVNVEADYHEQQVGRQPSPTDPNGSGGGRAVPMTVEL
jgi:protoporphyrinogen oxidase